MKKLFVSTIVLLGGIVACNASNLEVNSIVTFKESSFLVQNNYILVIVVKTKTGSLIEINGYECALRYIEQAGGEIVGTKNVPSSGPTPLRCADLPGSDGTYPGYTEPGSGGGGSGGGTSGGGGKLIDFEVYDPNKDYIIR